jgi:hypothetical protein
MIPCSFSISVAAPSHRPWLSTFQVPSHADKRAVRLLHAKDAAGHHKVCRKACPRPGHDGVIHLQECWRTASAAACSWSDAMVVTGQVGGCSGPPPVWQLVGPHLPGSRRHRHACVQVACPPPGAGPWAAARTKSHTVSSLRDARGNGLGHSEHLIKGCGCQGHEGHCRRTDFPGSLRR